MAWDIDVCGSEALFMPENEKCDECELFAEQLAELTEEVSTLQTALDNKQDVLTPGDGIGITGQTISAERNATNTYTKEEVDALLSDLEHISMQVVDSLPQTGDSNVIYLMEDAQNPGTYDMYVYTTEDGWVPIGSTDVDLSNYVQTEDLAPYATSAAVASTYATKTALANSHTQYLHTFTTGSWTLQSSGTWNGWYKQTKTGRTIYNPAGHVRASGSSLDAPPSDAVRGAVAGMEFEIDDSANTLAAYTKTAPTVTVYVSVEGVA